jgi:hypothetical protein
MQEFKGQQIRGCMLQISAHHADFYARCKKKLFQPAMQNIYCHNGQFFAVFGNQLLTPDSSYGNHSIMHFL